ncbi:MAG: hypothetical protein JOZ82_00255 [Marmoricola sp.]|nr:hypothetical protein [Marmoricola sp.]
MSASPTAETARVELALAPALRLRLLGTGLLLVGLLVVLGVVVTALAGGPDVVVTVVVVLGAVGVLVLGLLLGVRRWVLRVDDVGYRVRVLRAGARAARWVDVLDLQAINSGRARLLVLRLRDGRTTTLPVDSVEGGPVRLTELLTARLEGRRRRGTP